MSRFKSHDYFFGWGNTLRKKKPKITNLDKRVLAFFFITEGVGVPGANGIWSWNRG